jgi:NhaA family Na+:H+ antiporter
MRGSGEGRSMLEAMEHALVGWSGYVIVPVFGFANAGVALTGGGIVPFLAPLPLAVGAGLVVGKQAGILGCIALCDRLGIARRPTGASWAQAWGTAILCGIGFTMSLFIAELAFPFQRALIEQAKLGILAGSLVSAVLGYTVLRLAGRRRA